MGWRESAETIPRIPTPPPFMTCRFEGMVGMVCVGPWPLRETSKRAIRQSVPAKNVPGEVHNREDGV